MDYILSKIEKEIELSEYDEECICRINLYRVWFEYVIVSLFSSSYNMFGVKNKNLIDQIISDLNMGASAGKLLQYCEKMDASKVLLTDELKEKLYKYTSIRNIGWGHSFSCQKEDYVDFLNQLSGLFHSLKLLKLPFLENHHNLYKVNKIDGNRYFGTRYEYDGQRERFEMESSNISFDIDNVYSLDMMYDREPIDYSKFQRVSPFVALKSEHIYIIDKIKRKNLGQILYHHLFQKEEKTYTREWSELVYKKPDPESKTIEMDNGTIINKFERNYSKFVEEIAVPIINQIKDFLENKSSDLAVVRGMGGIGKTAIVQKLCDDLSKDEECPFSYIIFLTAKKRTFDYKEGVLRDILRDEKKQSNYVSSFEDIQRELREIFAVSEEIDSNSFCFKNNDERILLVIDDFESFNESDSEKITDAIKELNAIHHKVIITTRDQNVSSNNEIRTTHLSEKESILFLQEIHTFSEKEQRKLEDENVRKAIYKGTNGYPIVLLHLSEVIYRKGFDNSINEDFINSSNVFDYMYGNMYETLSPYARDLFCIMALFLEEPSNSNMGTLSGSIDDLRTVFAEEEDEATELDFKKALNDLKEYRILTTDDNSFTITTPLIIKLMKHRYEKSSPSLQKTWKTRYDKVCKKEQITNGFFARFAKLIFESKYNEIYNGSKAVSLKEKRVAVIKEAKECDNRGEDGYDVFKKHNEMFKGTEIFANYTIEWAKYARTKDNHKKDAIAIINEFFDTVDMDWSQTQLITLKGLLVLYRCKYIQENPNEGQDKGESVYKDVGKELAEQVYGQKMKFWEPQTIHYVGCALYSMAELLHTEKKRDEAIKICEIVISTNHYHFANLFSTLKSQYSSENQVADSQRKTTATPIVTQQKKTTSTPAIPRDWNVFITDFPIQNKEDAQEILDSLIIDCNVISKDIRTTPDNQKVYAVLNLETNVEDFIKQNNCQLIKQPKGNFNYTSFLSVSAYNSQIPNYNVHIRNLPRGFSVNDFYKLTEKFKLLAVRQPFKTTFYGYPVIDATFKDSDVDKVINDLNGKQVRNCKIVVERFQLPNFD